ncbi:acyclic terpene utilization AtuA family protein [Congregibacter litoralis]|uniref:Terpene utilization protein AtuA n=1 Tax=Congregibacter litoralis KT71 TaxID=314285 RepID=A4ABE5_9GAMM|nr:acyclic terpene utilization AtuA family protein [Congregibacter litoralis]EAQ96699.1 hypothetical protein KT71_06739 [Congregibacter litoralis KT71]
MTGDAQIRIGGASGYWGDAALATPQLLASGNLDYIVYDYLAEVTMSIMARARAADDSKGYATDFVTAAMGPNLAAIAEQGVKVLANAGGVNPRACAEALRALIAEQDLNLRVAVVLGDDIAERAAEFTSAKEMFSGEAFPDPSRIASINAYLGAFPIAAALDAGADIVITGRCVDSAVTLGAAIHAFGWQRRDYDKLAQGSLAGHILECGTQATGGNFTDWESIVDSLGSAGYPIATLSPDGSFTVSKPDNTGGLVSVGTVGEQMLYEIGDPGAYVLPDVICDFSRVELSQLGPDLVAVSGARGHGAPGDYKVSATWTDGFRAGQIWTMIGRDAPKKARHLAESIFARTEEMLARAGLEPLQETSVEILGVESHFGAAVRYFRSREVDVKLAVKHPSPRGVGIFLKEMVGLALTAPPGLASFAGARPKPTPVVRLFSLLIPKDQVEIVLELDGEVLPVHLEEGGSPGDLPAPMAPPPVPELSRDSVAVPLELLAFGRSGDKGDKANIGIMARHPDYLPWIAAALTPEKLASYFAHFLKPGQSRPVDRFYLPGTQALNFLLHDVLGGGGVASLRADPQGKAYAQLLLTERIDLPRSLALQHQLPISE